MDFKYPHFLQCDRHPVWRKYRQMLELSDLRDFDEEIFLNSQIFLEKGENNFLKAQDTKYMFLQCEKELHELFDSATRNR